MDDGLWHYFIDCFFPICSIMKCCISPSVLWKDYFEWPMCRWNVYFEWFDCVDGISGINQVFCIWMLSDFFSLANSSLRDPLVQKFLCVALISFHMHILLWMELLLNFLVLLIITQCCSTIIWYIFIRTYVTSNAKQYCILQNCALKMTWLLG